MKKTALDAIVKCILCRTTINRSSNTTNFWRHLEAKNNKQYEKSKKSENITGDYHTQATLLIDKKKTFYKYS